MREERLQKRRETLISATYFLLIGTVLFLILKYALPFFMPFLIGFAVAFLLKPISRKLCGKLHLGGKFCGAAVVIVSYILIVVLLWLIGGKVIEAAQAFASSAQQIYEQHLAPILEKINEMAVQTAAGVSLDLAGQTDQVLNGLASGVQSTIASVSQSILMSVAQIGMKIPEFFVGLIFAVMSSIFISSDYTKIAEFLAKLFPKNKRHIIFETKGYAVQTTLRYVKAYFILMLITFAELCIGLFFIQAQNPIGIAAAIAVCDALPLLGIGIALIPWALICFATGKLSFAIGLLVIYVIISVVRGFLEPKILGKQLGLHPLATLLSIYIGMKTLGIIGMILFPILLQIIVCLYRAHQPKELKFPAPKAT